MRFLFCFSPVPPSKSWDNTSNQVITTSFHTLSNPLTILSFGAIYCELLKASLIKPRMTMAYNKNIIIATKISPAASISQHCIFEKFWHTLRVMSLLSSKVIPN
jgi:hypothetical protein